MTIIERIDEIIRTMILDGDEGMIRKMNTRRNDWDEKGKNIGQVTQVLIYGGERAKFFIQELCYSNIEWQMPRCEENWRYYFSFPIEQLKENVISNELHNPSINLVAVVDST